MGGKPGIPLGLGRMEYLGSLLCYGHIAGDDSGAGYHV